MKSREKIKEEDTTYRQIEQLLLDQSHRTY